MPFFEPEPPSEPEAYVDHRRPDWAEPPRGTVGGSVGLDVLLVNTGDVAAWIHDVGATPVGITFSLTVAMRAGLGEDFHLGSKRDDRRFGVAFADGRKTAGDALLVGGLSGDEATEINLAGRGGHGNGRTATEDHWLWPLPPEGPLTFAFSWPAEGIDEVLVEVDSAPFREAAGRAVELWPDDRPLRPEQEPGRGRSWMDYT